MSQLNAYILPSLADVTPEEWDLLAGDHNPFLSYSFLRSLEQHDCVGENFGWYPVHLTIRDDDNLLVAAMPMYVKTNYYGEFVFDWNWDSAYEQAGLDYYPKLVVSIPYTPATGTRLLIHPDVSNADELREILVSQALNFAKQQNFSSVHWLFTDQADTDFFRQRGFTLRMGCNFHWHNNQHTSFDDLLAAFSSKKRKNIKRERRIVADQSIIMRRYHGSEISDDLLQTFTRFYTDTFDKKNGVATLNEGFFFQLRNQLQERMILVAAEKDERPVAAALFFRGKETLYGRYWGCERDYHSLHFETCYYQGLEIAIEAGLKHLDPGVQGEHKIPRGFLPTATWSAHWLADEKFAGIIHRYCADEREAIEEHCRLLWKHSPYRDDATPPTQHKPETACNNYGAPVIFRDQ